MVVKSKRARYQTHKRIAAPEITEWLRMVETGKIVACEDMHLLCAYVRHVFATEKLWVDKDRLARYMSYQKYFPFRLAPEEKFMIALWLCTFREGFFPRWTDLFIYIGRGWGKTGFGGFATFCMLSPANGIKDYDVDVCATVEEQSRIGYDDLWRIFEGKSDLFSQGFDWNKIELRSLETGSRFKYWSGNSSGKDGMRSGCVWFDEEHAYEDAASMEVFTGGLGKKDHPRRLKTTTDGDVRDGPLDEDKVLARAILRGEEQDGGMLPFMCHLDSLDEIHDEAMWPKANPRLTRSETLLFEYRNEYRTWNRNPQRHPATPTKRFNIPQGRSDIAVTSWENLMAASRSYDLASLRKMPCVIGIDYAKTTDMVGAIALRGSAGTISDVLKSSAVYYFSVGGGEDGWGSLMRQLDVQYEQLADAVIAAMHDHATPKWIYTLAQPVNGTPEQEDEHKQRLKTNLKSFISSSRPAVMPLFSGQKMERVSEGANAHPVMPDAVAAIRKDMFETAAVCMRIPTSLMYGNTNNFAELVSSLLTFAVDPVARALETELTRKTYNQSQWAAGARVHVDTTHIRHVDLFEVADKIEKLVGSSIDNPNEIRGFTGQDRINKPWADEYQRTKNHEDAGGGETK
ncbi:phage portal protein [Atopobium fossor]|uniref:phage portal protein n=1 Tax=Atopobium fossor TaxID=39487 RepID=UPI0003FC238D|nr:phage portal protein [Atopobium fossor]